MAEVSNGSLMEAVSLSDNEETILEEVQSCDPNEEPTVDEDRSNKRLLEMEQERGQLTAEVLAKDNLISKLEKETASLKSELTHLETSHANVVAEQEKKYLQLYEEMSAKVAELTKQYMNANKEKEAMVMKYVLGEKDIIIQKKQREEAEKKMKAALKERDDAVNKSKTAMSEKVRLQQLADSRLQDNNVLKKEVDRWKEEVKIQESKAAQSASKFKSEVDAHRETREKLDKTISHLSETRAEIDKTRQECADFMKKLKDEDEAIIKRQQTAEKEQSVKLMIDKAAANELETLREKYQQMSEENSKLAAKVQSLDKERSEQESLVVKLRDTIEVQKGETVDLMAQVAEMESLKMNLSNEEEKLTAARAESDRLRADLAELSNDMDSCRKKESELLEFTQKLTEKNVTLQSDLAFIEGRAAALEAEHVRLSNKVSELEASNSKLKIELELVEKNRKIEAELLAKKLAEASKNLEVARQKVTDGENEVSVLKRKNQAGIRELTRELKECQRKLESSRQFTRSPTLLSQSSRASSNSSLNRLTQNGDENTSTSPTVSCGSNLSLSISESYSNGHTKAPNPLPQVVYPNVPDSQVLVEKIVKLQKELAKRQEKLDFMEEHVSTMVEEMKKKNKLLQHLMLKQDAGALVSSDMDENKRRTSEQGGIMSSLYSSKPNDCGMTLELSLEINKKLQSVLEDTILKNITLKENINTLGREIATLSTTK